MNSVQEKEFENFKFTYLFFDFFFIEYKMLHIVVAKWSTYRLTFKSTFCVYIAVK